MNKVTIYSKVCLPCVMKQEWADIQKIIWRAGYEINIVRTTYDAQAHKEAAKLWGSDDYVAFGIAPNGEALSLKELKHMFEEIKDKMVSAGKTKPVRKGKKNVQRLRKTKGSIRVDTVEDSPAEIKVETEAR